MIYFELFYTFFFIGLFTIGGGYAMIPLMRDNVVNKGWIGEDAFLDMIGVSESTPGPFAINMATFVGSRMGGILGSIVATIGIVLPSFIIILLIASILKNLMKKSAVINALDGVKPVVTALILGTGITLMLKNLGLVIGDEFSFNYKELIIFCIIAFLYFGLKKLFKKKISAILIVLMGAILGIIIYL